MSKALEAFLSASSAFGQVEGRRSGRYLPSRDIPWAVPKTTATGHGAAQPPCPCRALSCC